MYMILETGEAHWLSGKLLSDSDAETRYRVQMLLRRHSGWSVYFLPGAFLLSGGSEFGAITHDDTHCAFMTLPPYASTREGEARPLGSGPQPCQMGLGVRKCPQHSLKSDWKA